jgi:type I restriction enzyme S subunit
MSDNKDVMEDDVINPFLYYNYLTLNWQTSDGGVIKRLYNNNLKEMVIYYPTNKTEQQKIANSLSSADDLIEAQALKIKTLKNHKKGLMQQLFPQSITN